MRTMILILPMLAVVDCCDPDPDPAPPYGKPDDVSSYEEQGGYRVVNYTYFCLDGQYVSVNYGRANDCSDFDKTSEYRSSGSCGNGAVRERLEGLSSNARLLYLIAIGQKVDTVRTRSSSDGPLLVN